MWVPQLGLTLDSNFSEHLRHEGSGQGTRTCQVSRRKRKRQKEKYSLKRWVMLWYIEWSRERNKEKRPGKTRLGRLFVCLFVYLFVLVSSSLSLCSIPCVPIFGKFGIVYLFGATLSLSSGPKVHCCPIHAHNTFTEWHVVFNTHCP